MKALNRTKILLLVNIIIIAITTSSSIVLSETISCLGDSITNGYPYSGTDNTYPSKMLTMLTKTNATDSFNVINNGVNGYRADQVLANISTYLNDNPNYVLLLVGGNDLTQEVLPDGSNLTAVINQTVSEVQEIVNQSKSHLNPDGSNPKIIVSTIIPTTVQLSNTAVKLYNTTLQSNLTGADLLITSNWDDFYNYGTGEAKTELMYDTVHPNTNGYTVIAENWFEALDQLFSSRIGTKWYLPEGCTNGFSEWILIMNPNTQSAPVRITFMKPDGSTVIDEKIVTALSRHTINVNQYIPNDSVSTMVESLDNIPIIVERAMYWDSGDLVWSGGHNATGLTSLATEWYLAEGCTLGSFDTWILLMNPNNTTANVTATFMKSDGTTVEMPLQIGTTTRYTIHVNQVVPGDSVSVKIVSDIPIAVERAMYWDSDGYNWIEGHVSTGVTSPSTQWYLAEGCTNGFDMWVLIMNQNTQATSVTVTFMKSDGNTIIKNITVPATSRYTIYANDSVPNESISTQITSDLPIVVERAMYWNSGDKHWAGGHVSQGTVLQGTKWYLAEGYTGGSFSTWLLIMNPNSTDANVKVTFIKPDGTNIDEYLNINATSRYTLYVNDYISSDSVSIKVESTNGVPIIAERAMYWDSGGYHWKGGHASTGISPLGV